MRQNDAPAGPTRAQNGTSGELACSKLARRSTAWATPRTGGEGHSHVIG